VELTTAIRVRWRTPARTPAHSLALAYEAITAAHSATSVGTMLRRPELPDVAATQYRP
jgi:hypothetical protein